MGKRGFSRKGARFAVVFAFAVLGSSALGGVASAAPSRSACSGRADTAACAPALSPHQVRIANTSTDATDLEPAAAETETVVADAPAQTVSKPAPATAPKVVQSTSSVTRADHKHGSSAPSGGVDPDCDEDDIGDAPDGGDDDEDCDGSGSSEEPCDDDDEAEDDDEGEDDDKCAEPEPVEEICGDGVDNNEDGEVDEDCDTVEPEEPETEEPSEGGKEPTVVLPKTFKTLPKTGPDVSTLFLIGIALIAAGGATRIRTRPLRVVFAGQGSVAELVLVQYLNHVATHRVLRPPRR